MLKGVPKDVEGVKKRWDAQAKRYDKWYERFGGAVEHYVDWELLKAYLPRNKDAKILDAAGGTGRITVPMAKMGYSVTLCDISPGMLNVAGRKVLREGVSDKVEIVECDVCRLRFDDESFDFVLCWDGGTKAIGELVRVTKKGGRVSVFLVNKLGYAISGFFKDPSSSLDLVGSKSSYVYDEKGKYEAFSVGEARELFEKEGVKVIDIYAVCGMSNILRIPQRIQDSRSWDKRLFSQVTEMLLRLSKEPSVKGLSRHFVVYGERV